MLLRTDVTHLITLIMLCADAFTFALLIKRENFKTCMSVISCHVPYRKETLDLLNKVWNEN